jgi:hypothetical protein
MLGLNVTFRVEGRLVSVRSPVRWRVAGNRRWSGQGTFIQRRGVDPTT